MLQKNKDKIRDTLKITKERRSKLQIKVYEVKLDDSHFNQKTKLFFDRIFLEAKWLYNDILSSPDIFKYDDKVKIVKVMNKDKEFEERKLIILGSQIKQEILSRTKDSIKGLSESKKKGNKIGGLKFKSFINSIPLKQYDNTFKIDFKDNTISIQNNRQWLKTNGLEQLNRVAIFDKEREISNATLVRKPSGIYLHITCYEYPRFKKLNGDLGIDFGIEKQLTFSNRIGVKFKIPVNKQIKKAQRKVSKSKKGSRNRFKLRAKLRKVNEKRNNQKQDTANKLVGYLNNNFRITMQDEMIKQWQSGLFGKAISESAMGEIKSLLKSNKQTQIVPRRFPSSQLCYCGSLNKFPLNIRIYSCACGYMEDRDIHGAEMMLAERKYAMPVEDEATAAMLEYFKTIPNIDVSFIQKPLKN